MDLQITSNFHWNNFLYGYELTKEEKASFDWIDPEDIETHSFLKYKGNVYSIGDFMIIDRNEALEEWDGYASDSFFSGVLIKLSDDGEQYQVGTYIS